MPSPSVVRVRPFAVRACSFLCCPRPPAPCCPRPSLCPAPGRPPPAARVALFHVAHARLSLAVRTRPFAPCPSILVQPMPACPLAARPCPLAARGSGVSAAASTCRSEVYIYRCGRNRCRNRRRISSPIGEERGAADRRLRGVSFPNGRSFLPETIFLR